MTLVWADPVSPGIRRVAKQFFPLLDTSGADVTSNVHGGGGGDTNGGERDGRGRQACVELAFAIVLPPREMIPMQGWAGKLSKVRV